MAKVPFSDDIVFQVLDKIHDDDFVQSLVNDLRCLFKVCTDCYMVATLLHPSYTKAKNDDSNAACWHSTLYILWYGCLF